MAHRGLCALELGIKLSTVVGMPIRLIVGVALAVIVALVFPLINYKPGAGAADYSMHLLVLLGIGAIILRIVAMKKRR